MKKRSHIILCIGIAVCAIMSVYCSARKNKAEASFNREVALRQAKEATKDKMVVAYVTDRDSMIPSPSEVTHIFYSFANISDSYDSFSIPNFEKFRRIVALKDSNPQLKVCLSIQTTIFDGFAVMTASDSLRGRFVENCKKFVDKYSLDGIDLDWEFPGSKWSMHQGGGKDDELHYAWLARDLRKSLGNECMLTVYSNNSGKYIDFKAMLPYLDYVMMSGYNLGMPPEAHQSNLYPSKTCGDWSISKSLEAHLDAGIPREKLLLGIPFFARTQELDNKATYIEPWQFKKYLPGYKEKWDNKAKVPYYVDGDGKLLAAFDNPKSIKEKCKFIKDQGLAGAFYWNYNADAPDHALINAVRDNLLPKN